MQTLLILWRLPPIKYSRYRADEAKSGKAPFGTFLSTDVAVDEDLIDALRSRRRGYIK